VSGDDDVITSDVLSGEVSALVEYLESGGKKLPALDAMDAIDEEISLILRDVAPVLEAVRNIRRTTALHRFAVGVAQDHEADTLRRSMAGGLVHRAGAASGEGSIRDARQNLQEEIEKAHDVVNRLHDLYALREALPRTGQI
jgi:hypothetical protein